MVKVRYEEMFPHEVVAARKDCPVAFLPVGGIEWHGQHNCLGLDTVKAHNMGIECAQNTGGLVFPPLYYGEPRQNYLMESDHDEEGKIKEKMKIPENNFKSNYLDENKNEADFNYVKLLVRTLKEIRSLNFKIIILLAGHYPLLSHCRAATEIFNLQTRGKTKAWATSGYELIQEEIPEAGDHAAAWETSLMLYFRPELVDMEQLPESEKKSLIGVMGRDPRKHASSELGKKGVKLIIDKIDTKIKNIFDKME